MKRPKFARMAIEQEQFIVMKKTPIKDDYELTKKIGKGAYGSVYRSKEKSSGELRAIKVIEKVRLNKDEYNSLVNEFEILRRMDHPYIIKLYEIYDDRKNMYVVT